jgi:hypothetical protein
MVELSHSQQSVAQLTFRPAGARSSPTFTHGSPWVHSYAALRLFKVTSLLF